MKPGASQKTKKEIGLTYEVVLAEPKDAENRINQAFDVLFEQVLQDNQISPYPL
jgi:hypothetical protein